MADALCPSVEKKPPVCSVIIPTKNGGATFRQVLDLLSRQTLWDRTELIVVDSGSEDDTLLNSRQAGARVFEIPPHEFNHGLSRDYGISKAKAECIILMVQDAVPADPHLLETLVSAMAAKEVAGAYARQIPRPDACVLTKRNLNNWLTGRTVREVRAITDEASYAALTPIEKFYFCNFDNVCSAIKKSVWLNEPFGLVNFGEDIDWARRVLLRHLAIVYEPEAAVIHSHDRTLRYEYKRTYVCHRKLYALFKLHLVQNIRGLCRSWLHASATDIVYVFKAERNWSLRMRLAIRVLALNLLGVWGQYLAVRHEIRGVSKIVRGV